MSLSLVLAPLLILGAPGDAKDRLIKWRAAAPSLSFNQTVVLGAPGRTPLTMKATYKQSPGLKLRYEVTAQGITFGQIQNGETVMATNSQARKYAKYYMINVLSGPSPAAPPELSQAFPNLFMDKDMRSVKGDAWKVSGEFLTFEEQSDAGKINIKLSVGPKGEPKSYEIKVEGETSYSATSTFSNFSTAAIAASAYSVQPPLGWVPTFLKEPARPWDIGSKPKIRVYRDGLKGSTFDLTSAAMAQGTVVCLIAADCPVSARLVARLDALKAALKKEQLGLRVISLGSTKPTAWAGKVFWDQSGAVEKDLTPPSTPYFYTLDKKGVITSAWLGYVSGEEAKIASLLAAKS